MKLTKEKLRKIIQEQMEEAITKADTSLSVDQADPNDNLFRIMDQVQDRAMKYLNITDEELKDKGLDSEFSRMSNEIVTNRLPKLIEQMVGELVQRYLMK